MRTFSLILLLAACTQEPTIVEFNPTIVVPEQDAPTIVVEVPENENDTDTETPNTDTEIEDLCDVKFRVYTEDGHYMDVNVGARPAISMTTALSSWTVDADNGFFTSFEVSSIRDCGSFEIVGVQTIIERADGQPFSYHREFEASASLRDLETNDQYTAPVSWSGSTRDYSVAHSVSFTFDAEYGPSSELGDFNSKIVRPNDSVEYWLDFPVGVSLPPGEYMVSHAVAWVDQETSTKVWYYNFDGNGAVQHVTIL